MEPKCVLCDGNHPANYKGCIVYKQIQNKKFPKLRDKKLTHNVEEGRVQTNPPPAASTRTNCNTNIYANIASGNSLPTNINNVQQEPLKMLLNKMIETQNRRRHKNNAQRHCFPNRYIKTKMAATLNIAHWNVNVLPHHLQFLT